MEQPETVEYVLWLEGFTKIHREVAEVKFPTWCPLGREGTRATPPNPWCRQTPRLLLSQLCAVETFDPYHLTFSVRSRKLSSAARCKFPSIVTLVHGGCSWERVLINTEYLPSHCHVLILALPSNHRKTAWRRRLQVASGACWEAECNFHVLKRSHAQFEAPPRHKGMLKNKMLTN